MNFHSKHVTIISNSKSKHKVWCFSPTTILIQWID